MWDNERKANFLLISQQRGGTNKSLAVVLHPQLNILPRRGPLVDENSLVERSMTADKGASAFRFPHPEVAEEI